MKKQLKILSILFLFFVSVSTVNAQSLSGDANGDGRVDGVDFSIWLNHYNTFTSNGSSDGDFNNSGKVDGVDFSIWLNNYGKVGPTAVPTKAPTQTPKPTATIPVPTVPPTSPSGGVWISREEIKNLPNSGSAWNNIVSWANQSTTPDIQNQDNQADAVAVASAFVCVRNNSTSHCNKARNLVMGAIGTEAGGRTLALGRNLAGYIVAADLVGFNSSSDETKFRNWVSSVRTKTLDGKTLISTHEDRPNNWGTHAGTSRIAAAIYLNDKTDLQKAAKVFEGWLGNRSAYDGFSYSSPFGWHCNTSAKVGINPNCSKNGHSLDGVLPDDQRRGGDFTWPPPKENYVYEALQGVVAQAWLLHRQGYPAFSWSNQAIRRSMNWLHTPHFSGNSTFPATGDDAGTPWIVNRMYGTNFPTNVAAPSKNGLGFYDWTHGK